MANAKQTGNNSSHKGAHGAHAGKHEAHDAPESAIISSTISSQKQGGKDAR